MKRVEVKQKTKKLLLLETENIRKNTDTINNNKTQEKKYERKNLYLFSLIWIARGHYQENVFQSH